MIKEENQCNGQGKFWAWIGSFKIFFDGNSSPEQKNDMSEHIKDGNVLSF